MNQEIINELVVAAQKIVNKWERASGIWKREVELDDIFALKQLLEDYYTAQE